MSDGVAGSSDPGILPMGFVPLGVGHIVEKWRMLTDIAVEVWPADELAQWEGEPAGTKAFGFLRSWLPVGSNFGNGWLFVDLRPGPRSNGSPNCGTNGVGRTDVHSPVAGPREPDHRHRRQRPRKDPSDASVSHTQDIGGRPGEQPSNVPF
jgi:hypothetical protein